MSNWITRLSDDETNVHAWVELGGGRWLALTVWGYTVFEWGLFFEDDLRKNPDHWEELT